MSKEYKKNICKKVWMILLMSMMILGAATTKGCGNSTKKPDDKTTISNQETTDSKDTTDKKDTSKKEEANVPTEYKSALKKAKTYSDTMNMSKAGIYNQLTSQYGEKFSAEAAQYAIDNVQANWNENALKKAKTYQDTMSMSPSAIHDQLISENGEKFTAEEAQYAIDHLK